MSFINVVYQNIDKYFDYVNVCKMKEYYLNSTKLFTNMRVICINKHFTDHASKKDLTFTIMTCNECTFN